MEKILVLGNKGMLGHVLFAELKAFQQEGNYEVLGINRNDSNEPNGSYKLDASNEAVLVEFIRVHKPKYVVNCIGILVEQSIKRPVDAIRMNSLLPHFLDELSIAMGFKLIHISTDCVFDGFNGPYKEND